MGKVLFIAAAFITAFSPFPLVQGVCGALILPHSDWGGRCRGLLPLAVKEQIRCAGKGG